MLPHLGTSTNVGFFGVVTLGQAFEPLEVFFDCTRGRLSKCITDCLDPGWVILDYDMKLGDVTALGKGDSPGVLGSRRRGPGNGTVRDHASYLSVPFLLYQPELGFPVERILARALYRLDILHEAW